MAYTFSSSFSVTDVDEDGVYPDFVLGLLHSDDEPEPATPYTVLNEDVTMLFEDEEFQDEPDIFNSKHRGDPVTIADVSYCAEDILTQLDLTKNSPCKGGVDGMEVGDDDLSWSDSVKLLAVLLVTTEEIMKNRLSPGDCGISSHLFNLAEVTSEIPCSPAQSFLRARKSGSFKDLGFTDVIPLRVQLPVAKGKADDFSSTVVGKVAYVSVRLGTPRERRRPELHLASLFQDALLRTDKSPEPKYLPKMIGGSGCPPLFERARNSFHYVHLYKSGTYERVYGSAISELETCTMALDQGNNAMATPYLCAQLRDKQEYLWGTYGPTIFIPTMSLKKRDGMEGLPPPVLQKVEGYGQQSVVERLRATRHLVSRRGAELEVARTAHFTRIFFSRDISEEKKVLAAEQKLIRSKFGGVLRKNASFQRLLSRTANHTDVEKLLASELFNYTNAGKRTLDFKSLKWLLDGGKHGNVSYLDLSIPDDYFIREELSCDQHLRVQGIPLTDDITLQERLTVTRAGLWEISGTMIEWADRKAGLLLELRQKYGSPIPVDKLIPLLSEDLEWVNDDTGIIQRALIDCKSLPKSSIIAVISDDRKLCKRLQSSLKRRVLKISPSESLTWLLETSKLGLAELICSNELVPLLRSSREYLCEKIDLAYWDTGSVAAEAISLDCLKKGIKKRTFLSYGITKEGLRFSKYILEDTESRIRYEVLG